MHAAPAFLEEVTHQHRCPNPASPRRGPVLGCAHVDLDARSARLRTGAPEPRSALRRPVLHRGHQHAHLLPAGVPSADAEAAQRDVLPQRRGGGSGGVPAVPAMPPGAVARRRRVAPRRRCDGARAEADRCGTAGGAAAVGAGRTRAPRRAPVAPPVRRTPRRAAQRRACDAAPAVREAVADGNLAADHRNRARRGLRQPAPFQHRVPRRATCASASLRRRATRWGCGWGIARRTTSPRCSISCARAHCPEWNWSMATRTRA